MRLLPALVAGRHLRKDAGKGEVCPLLPAGTSSATRLLGKIQVTHRCHFLELQMLRFSLLQRKRTREKKRGAASKSLDTAECCRKALFFFLIIILVGVPCFHGYPLWRSPLLGSALIPGVAGGPQRWDAVVSGRGRMRVSHSDCTASSACLLLLPCPEKGNPVLCSMPSSPPAGFSHTGDTLL